MGSWSKFHEEITGIGSGEVQVNDAEDPYPSMIYVEIDAGTILSDDARDYALMLLAAADEADGRNERAFGR